MTETEVLKIKGRARIEAMDTIVEEVPLTVEINGRELVTLLCSPEGFKELVTGFLYSNGLIGSLVEVKSAVIDEKNRIARVRLKTGTPDARLVFKRVYTSGCGRGVIFYNALDTFAVKKIAEGFPVPAEKIADLMDIFEGRSVVFKKTGGVHSAGFSDGRDILVFREDIGRHNALDKAVGEALIKGLSMKDLLILLSGRISSEIILKAARTGSPFVISRSAPTVQAVKLAQKSGITLIGFARGKRMNVYSGQKRIT